MKKIIKNNPEILISIVLNILYIITGSILMTFPALGMVEPIYFISIIFFIFSFLNIAAYFMAKKNIDYELLFMALLNLLIGTFLFIMQYEEESFILGTFVLAYTIGTLLIKGYYTEILKRKNNNMWKVKFVTLFLLGLIGLLTSINLYNEMSVYTIMFAYYFITFGIINLFEPISKYLTQSGYIKIIKRKN